MPDLGLDVIFKGKNAVRLLGGLGVALRISLISVIISILSYKLDGLNVHSKGFDWNLL